MQSLDQFQLSDAPEISGLVFRRFRGLADIPQMWSVRQQVAATDKIDLQSSRESLPTEAEFTKDLSAVSAGTPNWLIVEHDNQIIGYSTIEWWTEQNDNKVYLHLGWLLAEWRNKGIGTAMVHFCQARVRELVPEQTVTGKVELATNVSSTEVEAGKLMQNEGYSIVHTLSDMVLPELKNLPEVTFPAGLEVRPVVAEHFRAIFEVFADAYSTRGSMPKFDEHEFQRFVANKLGGDLSLHKVGWFGNQTVGIVLCDIRNWVGTIEEVEVRKAYQRRGIARALLAEALATLAARGIHTARLYTAADNREGARTLYENFGFREIKQHYFYRKPLN